MTYTLQNAHWQAEIDPKQGGSLLSGKVKHEGDWKDIIRPASKEENHKPGSFLMLPWANRIRDGVLRFEGEAWQLKTEKDDGTARHGDVRKRAWRVVENNDTKIHMRFDSTTVDDFNFPFALLSDLIYELDGSDFVWQVTLTNHDERAFPAGFGFHPYFQHPAGNMPLLEVPCSQQYELTGSMVDEAAIPVTERLDFREARAVTDKMQLDDLLTGRNVDEPMRLIYEDWGVEIQMWADNIFQHVIVFTSPDGTLAVEPQTNANDGFNLREDGIAGSGVFVVQPGEQVNGTVRLSLDYLTR